MNVENLEILIVLAIGGVVIVAAAWVVLKLIAKAMKVVGPTAAVLGIVVSIAVGLQALDVDLPAFDDLEIPAVEELKQKAEESVLELEKRIEPFLSEFEDWIVSLLLEAQEDLIEDARFSEIDESDRDVALSLSD